MDNSCNEFVQICAAVVFTALVTTNGVGAQGNCLSPKFQPIPGHTACIVPGGSPTASGISSVEKDLIVDKHNEYRAVPNAQNMQRMVWDDEIATIAQRWANNCDFNHDSVRFIPGRFTAGQNLAAGYRSWESVVAGWYNEVDDFTFGDTSQNFGAVGHYTQIVWANSAKIGCGFADCPNINKFYVCNYGPAGNSDFSSPYERGNKCGSCPSNCVNNLCDCGGKVCQNGGTLDLETCQCSCKHEWHYGDECYLNCTGTTEYFACGNQFTQPLCLVFTNVPDDCPHLCDVCPYGAGSPPGPGSDTTPISGPTTPISGPTTPISGPTTPISGPTPPISGPTTPISGNTVTGDPGISSHLSATPLLLFSATLVATHL